MHLDPDPNSTQIAHLRVPVLGHFSNILATTARLVQESECLNSTLKGKKVYQKSEQLKESLRCLVFLDPLMVLLLNTTSLDYSGSSRA